MAFVFLLSIFLDNIAGCDHRRSDRPPCVPARGYRRFPGWDNVAAANAGGAGSVIGDTTTTMMWISGIHPLEVVPAFVGAVVAFAVFAPFAAMGQHRASPLVHRDTSTLRIDWTRVAVVGFVLATLVGVNVVANGSIPSARGACSCPGFRFVGSGAAVRDATGTRLVGSASGLERVDVSRRPCSAGIVDADRRSTGPVRNDHVRFGGSISRVRQHSADSFGAQSGRIRLGASRVRGRIRWLDGLVRVVGRCRTQ